MDILTDRFDRRIRLTDERKTHIFRRSEMINQEAKIIETLKDPDIISYTALDKTVHLYYKFYKSTPVTQKYLLVAVKILNSEGFIVASFFTNKVKKGELIWQKT